jgi:hypothetical protein
VLLLVRNEKPISTFRDPVREQGKTSPRRQAGNEDGWFVER